MIQVNGLIKNYGNKTVLNGVSFQADKGEILGLLGKNGAGKSTTMNIITGNLSATEGTVTVDGHEISEEPFAAKRKIGYLPELPPVYPEMTVKKYLEFVYGLKKCSLPRDGHLKEICERTKITDVSGRVIRNLSKGYRQRVGIAQALIGYPEVFILDEPMVGLDPQQIVEIRELICHLKKEHTVILSSHILTEIQSVCDHIVVLEEGRIAADGTKEELLNGIMADSELHVRIEGKRDKIESLLKGIQEVQKVVCLGVREKGSFDFIIRTEKGKDVRRELVYCLTGCHCPVLYMAPRELTLENIFLQLTEKS